MTNNYCNHKMTGATSPGKFCDIFSHTVTKMISGTCKKAAKQVCRFMTNETKKQNCKVNFEMCLKLN